MKEKKGYKEKSSGHGSITKAGKVRKQTPRVPQQPHASLSPRLRFKRRYRLQMLGSNLEFMHVR